MRFGDVIRMSSGSIARNKVRSLLTALGIVIGVASVIAMVHLGQSATRSVTDSISAMGSNLLIVQPARSMRGAGGVRMSSPPFARDDVAEIERAIAGVIAAPVVTTTQTLVFSHVNHSAQVLGTTSDYFAIRNWALSSGRGFDEEEIERAATVCVVGATVAHTMFGAGDPLGRRLRVGRSSCEVIGVLEARGASMGQDQDDTVVLPVGAVQSRLLGSRDVRSIYVSALEDGTTARVKRELEDLLRDRRTSSRGEDDFFVRDMQEVADTLEGTTRALTLLLGAIAAVSLLVGGIGIMNIMLVSVTERTREIGIRLAIGAKVRDVLTQFLLEAVALSCLGGALGVLLGVGGTWLATQQMGLPFLVSTQTMLVGFAFSALVGVIFGYFPARKAAKLHPIDALRHE
jgi:putative ABC transport system permease protein